MTLPRRVRTAAVARIATAALALSACILVAAAAAQPAPEGSSTARAASRNGVSLVASSTSVPTEGTFGFAASVALTAPADFVQVRLQVRRPTGRLLFQRTSIARDVPAGLYRASFERGLADLDLKPGAYPVTLEARVDQGSTREITVSDVLYVYDPDAAPTPFVLVVRVTGQPVSDPSGRFVSDPGDFTKARDDVAALARWVVREPQTRLSLAVPPLLLEEWRRVAEGYEVVSPGGTYEVAAEDAVPRGYAAALDDLASAIDTGRLELMSVPYADPDPAALEQAGLLGDVAQQFDVGMSATFAALEATPSAGASFANGCLSPALVSVLATSGARFAVVDAACVRAAEATPTSGVWSVEGWDAGAVLVADAEAGSALASESVRGVLDRAFRRQVSSLATETLVGLVELGPDAKIDAGAVERIGTAVIAAPWLRLVGAREVSESPRTRTLSAQPAATSDGAPADYWTEVAEARSLSEAFIAATGPNDAEASDAVRDSLVAESAGWSTPDGTWALADRGRAFAANAERVAGGVLGEVSVAAQDVTLSSASGKVPVSVVNGSDKQLQVLVRSIPLGGLTTLESAPMTTRILPGDNYLEIPVDLQSSIAGQLRIDVLAGTRVIATQTVSVRASYLERLAIIAAIGLVLLGMLFYIIRRVRQASAPGESPRVTKGTGIARGESTEPSPERYTVPEDPAEENPFR